MLFSRSCRDMQVCVALPMLVPETDNTHTRRQTARSKHAEKETFLQPVLIGPLFYSQMWHFTSPPYIPPALFTWTRPAFPLRVNVPLCPSQTRGWYFLILRNWTPGFRVSGDNEEHVESNTLSELSHGNQRPYTGG